MMAEDEVLVDGPGPQDGVVAEEGEDGVMAEGAEDRMKIHSPTVTVWWYTTTTIIICSYN